MSSFQIYKDVEKENPQHLKGNVVGVANAAILKERKAVGATVGLRAAKQTTQVNHVQTRSGFSTLNVNANGGNGFATARAVSGGGNKLALRLVGNNNKNTKDTNAESIFGQKKSTVVPVVEQFKTFSVYEDQYENENKQNIKPTATTTLSKISSMTTNTTLLATTSNLTKINEENELISNRSELERHHIAIKNDSLHKDFGGIVEDDTIFNTTPMSVSDVLSPMSIDRSSMSTIDAEDKENHGDLLQQLQHQQQTNDFNLLATANAAEQDQQEQAQLQNAKQQRDMIPTPRNDRQRFFEVVEYQMDILEYFRESEKKHLPKPNYMRRQQDINYSMRTILVDWLVEVSEEYNLDTETLYLSISYIDRFLSHMSVVRSKLQLVGTAAMYIAAKYEEIYPPDVGEFVFITDDTYTKAQVLRMEQLILKILAFDLCTPTPYVFVNTYAVLTDMPFDLKFLTMYICELSLLEADPYLRFAPSQVSAAAHALARYILDYAIWTAHLEEVTKYRLEDLEEVFLRLVKTHKAASTLTQQAIQEKYKGKKYNAVATLKPVEVTPEQYDEIIAKYNEVAAAEVANMEQQQTMTMSSNESVRRMISSLMFN